MCDITRPLPAQRGWYSDALRWIIWRRKKPALIFSPLNVPKVNGGRFGLEEKTLQRTKADRIIRELKVGNEKNKWRGTNTARNIPQKPKRKKEKENSSTAYKKKTELKQLNLKLTHTLTTIPQMTRKTFRGYMIQESDEPEEDRG